MFVVRRGRAATAAAVVFSTEEVTAAAMMKPGRPDLSAGKRPPRASVHRKHFLLDFLGGWGGGKTNQVHLLQVGGESKIKISCRRLLAGQR